jgi:hypothetical protein
MCLDLAELLPDKRSELPVKTQFSVQHLLRAFGDFCGKSANSAK